MTWVLSDPVYHINWIKNRVLRVPQGFDLDVLRQSHGTLIIKEPVCFRPLKPYIACNLTSMTNYCRRCQISIGTCSGFPASQTLQLHN